MEQPTKKITWNTYLIFVLLASFIAVISASVAKIINDNVYWKIAEQRSDITFCSFSQSNFSLGFIPIVLFLTIIAILWRKPKIRIAYKILLSIIALTLLLIVHSWPSYSFGCS